MLTVAPSIFAGPLPWEWCNGSWWQFDVQNNAGALAGAAAWLPRAAQQGFSCRRLLCACNSRGCPSGYHLLLGVKRLLACRPRSAGLCSEVPKCLRERILSFAGTSLIDNVNDQDKGVGELELYKTTHRRTGAEGRLVWPVWRCCLCYGWRCHMEPASAPRLPSALQLHLPSLPCLCVQAATATWTRPRASRSRAAASCAPTRPSSRTPPPCPSPSPPSRPCPTVSGK